MLEPASPLVNRLAEETSPYLLQHKDNPVAWQPWDPAALATARRANKPILLSVGYAACHWCHVMAHESFENPTIAAQMNALFVNIKVDREERPDIDGLYQQALTLLGEHGGWPLTMFLNPAGEPYWGGTYFPPQPRFGRPGLPQVLERLAAVYAEDPARVAKNTTALKKALRALSADTGGGAIPMDLADRVAARLLAELDPVEGGIGRAPKFPQPPVLKLLWRAGKRGQGNSSAASYRDAVELTLTKMSQGGIYDHLGGGFARYAVDSRWLVPHFEKMLYDNAQLIELLTWAWQDSGSPLYAQRVRETVAWTLREMRAHADDRGSAVVDAFASSLDADSEGEEGKFYVWSEAEIDALLGEDAALFKDCYDITPGGNWEGKTILNRSRRPRLGDDDQEKTLTRLREILFKARGQRVRPGWDDKVLADWNGLMIAALARAAPVFAEPDWLKAAENAFAFVTEAMTEDGRLRHSWRRGRLKHAALLDDYANLCQAALALDEATGDPVYLRQAEAWIQVLERFYWDSEAGGYFLTAEDSETLIVRTKTAHDSAVPAGNGTLVAVLARLYFLTGKTFYRDRAEAVGVAFSGLLESNFFSLATLINGTEVLHRGIQVVIVGDRAAADTQALLRQVHGVCLPNLVLRVIAPEARLPAAHPAQGKSQVGGAATAYVCHGPSCSLPLTAAAELRQALSA